VAIDLTSTEQTNVEAGATRPVYLVEWRFAASVEYLSCSGAITYDSQVYTEGGLKLISREDGKTATLSLPATSSRVAQIQANTWRGGICKITSILASTADGPTYALAVGHLVLDGVIEKASFSGEVITVIAKCKYYRGALVPRYVYDDVTSTPAVGSTSTWESENYSYEQWLKTTAAIQRLVRPGVNPQVTGRPSASAVNSFVPVENTGYKLLTAQGVYIPIVYGRASVPGHVFVEGLDAGAKYVGVAWCMGRVNSVEAVFINDEIVPTTVTAKHYLGTTTQTVSPALQSYTATSPQFSDDMILRTPAGNVGICYSVFRIPTSAISGAPRFRAIIQGRIVADPTSTASSPYYANTEWSFDFLTDTTDSGPNNYTLTLVGNAAIASPSIGLELDGTGDYATIPDGTAIGTQPFTLEIEIQADTSGSPEVTETLICHGSTTSPLSQSLKIDRVGDSILLYLSSDGSTWDIANGLSCGTLAVTASPEVTGRILVERVDNQISTYMNGVTQTGVVTTLGLFDSGEVWSIGACGAATELDGRVRSARLIIGQYVYGSPHAITNTPFSDSGDYTVGEIYSDKPALAWSDLARDPVNGLGATVTGVQAAMEYGDSPMDSGAPRCRIGLAISDPRLVESWLDMLAVYANSLYFPEGSNLKIIPDKIKDGTNGSGPELYSPTSPEFGSPLPTITTEDGISYSVSVELLTASTTSPLTGVSVTFGGVTIITSKTTVGTHGATVTAIGTSNTVSVVEDVGFNGTWGSLSVKRTHRKVTQWLPSTLSLDPAPEGDKPNAVLVTYKVPDELSGAWKDKHFGVMNADAIAGDPIVTTTLNLPGLYRIEEASNKAIAKLFREDRKTRVSFISTDEEFVAQPGDTVNPVKTQRGIDTPVWVESNQMVSYGRHRITGIIYRDVQYPDTDYTDADDLGTLYADGSASGYAEEPNAGGDACTFYACDAYTTYLSGVAEYFWPCNNDPADLVLSGTVDIPLGASNDFAQAALIPGACVSLDGWQKDQAASGPNASSLVMAEPDDHYASIVAIAGGGTAGLLWQTQRYWKTSGGVFTAWFLEIQLNLAADGTVSVTLNGPATINSPTYIGTLSSSSGAVPNDGLPHVIAYKTYGMPGDSFLWHDTITVGVTIYVDWVAVADSGNVINYFYNLGAASGQNASFDPTWPTAITNNIFAFAKSNSPVFGGAAYNGTATFTLANALNAWNQNKADYLDPNPACQLV